MAGVACIRTCNVRRRFSGGCGAIVTTRTRAGDAAVIKMRGAPCRRRMTHIARCGGLNMIGRFAGRCRTVMTRCTATADLRVIDLCCWFPRRRVVAGLTRIRARNMRIRFARCRGAVVT
jgi:hypothetical protein